MTDREKAISLLQQCLDERPYAAVRVSQIMSCIQEAVELLKAQEPIPCGEKIKAGDVVLDFYECGYCKNAIRKPWRYCPFCGKAVKWE